MSDKFIKEFGSIGMERVNLVRLPEISLSKDEKHSVAGKLSTNDNFLKRLVHEGWKKFSPKVPQEKHSIYLNRLTEEFEIIQDLGFVDYFLLVWRVINKARKLGAFIDWGRGSAAGSLIFFLIGVTGGKNTSSDTATRLQLWFTKNILMRCGSERRRL